MLKLDIFIRLEKEFTGSANKAPYLYCIDKPKLPITNRWDIINSLQILVSGSESKLKDWKMTNK